MSRKQTARKLKKVALVKATAKLAEPFKPASIRGPQPILIRNARGDIQANPHLDGRACRWPVAITDTTYFCANKTGLGMVYCEFHTRMAFPSPAPRRQPSAPQPIQALPAAPVVTVAAPDHPAPRVRRQLPQPTSRVSRTRERA